MHVVSQVDLYLGKFGGLRIEIWNYVNVGDSQAHNWVGFCRMVRIEVQPVNQQSGTEDEGWKQQLKWNPSWLGCLEHEFYFSMSWNYPNWLIFFRGLKPPTSFIFWPLIEALLGIAWDDGMEIAHGC